MAYKVKIDVFEGPFDLLLHLVQVNEMDIYDIRIAEITKAYLDYISEMEKLDLEVTGDFLVMAAKLINIKSRTLMPPMRPEDEEEEEEEIDEEMADIRSAQDLMRRLIEYREFKELAVQLGRHEDEELRRFYRNSVLPRIEKAGEDEEPAEMREDINLLFSAFARILEYTEGKPTHRVLEEEFHVEEKIEHLKRMLEGARRINVTEQLRRCLNKQEALATFLAMLEICKMRLARVRQGANYDEIYLVDPSEPIDDEED